MHDWFMSQLDFIFFVYGLAFLLLAAICPKRSAGEGALQPAWRWLSVFGLIHGAGEWLDMLSMGFGHSPGFKFAGTVLMAASFVSLIEFSRRSLPKSSARVWGWWVYFPLLLPAVFAARADLEGFNAACRYALGLPGSLLASFVLWRASKSCEAKNGFGLGLAALAMLVYAPASGLVVPKAGFFPASWLNLDSFAAFAGFPVQLLRTLCALAAAAGLWLYARSLSPRAKQSIDLARWLFPVLLTACLCPGWMATEWRGRVAETHMRQEILDQAVRIAQAINPEPTGSGSFTEADKTTPALKRMQKQLAAYGRGIGVQSIYTFSFRNGSIVFGPESIDSKGDSAPAALRREALPQYREVFKTANPIIFGPYTNELGTFVSGLAPVFDPRSGEVLMGVGTDVRAELWQERVARARLAPILLNLFLVLILFAGISVLELRAARPIERQRRLRHAETALVAALGLFLTVVASLAAFEVENNNHRQDFNYLAEAGASIIKNELFDLKEGLAAFARFAQTREPLSVDDFEAFVSPMTRIVAKETFEWVPRLGAAKKDELELEMRRRGFGGFAVFEKDPRGERIPVSFRDEYFPVCFAAPLAGNENALGFDLGSESILRGAIDEATRTGLPTAALSAGSMQENGASKSISIYHPVFGKGGENLGFASAVLPMQAVVDKAASPSGSGNRSMCMEILDLSSSGAPVLLSSYPKRCGDEGKKADSRFLLTGADSSFLIPATLYPLFVAGRSFEIVARPGPGFSSAHPARTGFVTGFAGFFLTLAVAGFVGFLRNRQLYLEGQVDDRTQALLQSEDMARKLSSAVEQSPVTVVITDLKGTIEYVNPKFVETTGFSREEAVGQNPRVLKSGEIPSEGYRELWETIASGREWTGEFHNKKRNGELYWEHASISPIRNASGQITHFLAVKEDITERKEMEEALRTSLERFDTILSSLYAGIVVVGNDNRVEFANQSFCEMFDLKETSADLRGLPSSELIEKIKDVYADPSKEIARIREILAQSRPVKAEEVSMSGRRTYIRDFIPILVDGKGYGRLWLHTNITSRKRGEEILHETNRRLELATERANAMAKQAEAANRAKSVFLANMSHEIRTPMNAILGFSQLMQRDTTLSPRQKRHLDTINRSGEHLLALINDILEMSKIEAGRTSLNPSAVDLHTMLGDLEMMFSARTEAKKLALRVEYTDEVPRFVSTDENKLRQILINLLGNAVKFTQEGGIVLRVLAEPVQGAELRLIAEVEDTGPGISQEEAGRLFQPFEQTGSGARVEGGTGLGLAISREFARIMGGDIAFTSRVGRGTVFRLEIQVEEADNGLFLEGADIRPVVGLGPQQPVYRILVADDKYENRKLLSEMLSSVGFLVCEAGNGEEAVREFEARRPDLILMDIRMPVMDGIEAARRIRATPEGGDMPIIAVTASVFEDQRAEAFEAGVDDFLAKPFREAELFEKLETFLGVEYVYADEAAIESFAEAEESYEDLTRESLLVLPEELIDQLHHATILGDMDLLLELIERAGRFDAKTARALRSLAERFDYQRLHDLFFDR